MSEFVWPAISEDMVNAVAVCLLLAQAPIAQPGPLSVEPAERDFGDLKAGALLRASCVLTNAGTEPLEIGEVATACGCQQPTLDRKVLKPGESAKLSLAVVTLSQPAGANRWKATVHYRRGGENFTAEALFTAKLTRDIDVEPVQIAGTFDKTFETAIAVHDRRANPKPVLRVLLGTGAVEATIGPMGTDGRQVIRLRAKADLPPGEHTDTVHLDTGDADYPELKIPIRLVKTPPANVSVHPEKLTLRWAPGQATATGLFALRASKEGQEFTIERVECDAKSARTKFAVAPGAGTVRITFDTADLSAAGSAELSIHIRDPQPRVIRVPVRWEVP